MTTEICNTDDIIDSRQVIERIEELQADRQEFIDALADEDITPEDRETAIAELNEWNGLNGPELAALEALAKEAEGYAEDWQYGAALIRDSYFETYAQELAEDCAPFGSNSPASKLLESWPYRCIDWEQAARELRMDYTSVEFDGVTYWVR